MNEIEKQLTVIRHGVTEIIPEEELRDKLKRSVSRNQPLRIKYGIDPTAPELHLGHSVPIRKLRDFQDLGHRVIFLVGDFTALIGDPTGRTETRPMLSPEEIKKNLKTYQEQAGKILDLNRTEFVFNSTWLSNLKMAEVIKLTSSFTAAQMLERKDFRQRYQEGLSPSLQEFIYPLMQGYDSVALKSDVEIGATEQKFNLLAGRTVQEAFGMEKQVVITVPILEGTDGVRKMSKTYGNYIPITAQPGEMFGKLMSIPDNLMEKYFRCLTSLPEEEIKKILSGHPKEAKERLALEVTSFYHGTDSGRTAQNEFDCIFSQKKAPDQSTVTLMYSSPIKMSELIHTLAVNAESHIEKYISKGEWKRLLKQGAIDVDGKPITDGDYKINPPGDHVIKVGKRYFLKLIHKK